MASLFDGMGPILRDVLGGSVTITPPDGSPAVVRAIFREDEVVIVQLDGFDRPSVLPMVHLSRADLPLAPPGSRVAPGNGKAYRVVATLPSASPATDANVALQLEVIPGASS